jgi:thiamine pyrophosphate-dependent acetolactate synthase large subunit-like protein
LVEVLVVQGVDTVFGVPGESYLAALDGLALHADRVRYGAIRMHQERKFLVRTSGSDLHNPDFAAALVAASRADGPTLVHVLLDTNVITLRTTLDAIRAAGLTRQQAG